MGQNPGRDLEIAHMASRIAAGFVSRIDATAGGAAAIIETNNTRIAKRSVDIATEILELADGKGDEK